jgi:BASS family bile acid:Na+ symporter
VQANSPIFFVFLPIALVIIMLGLGLALTIEDFRKVLGAPRAVLVALLFQTIVLPAACLGVIYAFGLEPTLAVGMMLLAASPGGTSSTLYSHLADGDVALNVTLTAINSTLAIVTMPLIVNFSLAHFLTGDQAIPLQFVKMLQVFALVLIPMAAGMFLRLKLPGLADRMARPVKVLSALFLIVVVLAALLQEWQTILTWAPVIGLAALTFNLISLALGYFGPLIAGVEKRQAIAIGLEIGIHNAALAIAIAMSPLLLNNGTMAIPAAVYGLIAYVTAAGFTLLLKRKHGPVAGQASGNIQR